MSTHDEAAARGRQTISEGLTAGYLRWVGERQLELTAKAIAHDLVLSLTHCIDLADQARRDFTEEELQRTRLRT